MNEKSIATRTQSPGDWKKKLGMAFTISRIAMTPFILFSMLFLTPWGRVTTCVFFILAAVTDYYDGYFARKYNGVSNLGKFLDPIADKVLVTGVLIMLLHQNSIDPYLVILVVIRDQLIGGLRSIAAADNLVIDAKPTGKWKTALQMTAIPLLILNQIPGTTISVHNLGYVALWMSVFFSLWSGFEYLQLYLKSTPKDSIKN
ncbi:MAG TPA: CDP-diacylglycerol--glycerol-3-phosphate 3-phosphatidyltransferase [Pseudobdellovibrionaceae bacterium]|nr:CDP-diacylglycerol--glycerol-3-phosphate 3-phosphatidyltransferase [Pseudobdellovibrionaceae bacterium]